MGRQGRGGGVVAMIKVHRMASWRWARLLITELRVPYIDHHLPAAHARARRQVRPSVRAPLRARRVHSPRRPCRRHRRAVSSPARRSLSCLRRASRCVAFIRLPRLPRMVVAVGRMAAKRTPGVASRNSLRSVNVGGEASVTSQKG